MVNIPSAVLVCIVGLEHLLFMIGEMFFWDKMGQRFGLKEHEIQITTPAMKNQGIYNGGLAVGLIWAVLMDLKSTTIYLLICVIIYSIIGAITVKKTIVITQGLPAIIALIIVIVLM